MLSSAANSAVIPPVALMVPARTSVIPPETCIGGPSGIPEASSVLYRSSSHGQYPINQDTLFSTYRRNVDLAGDFRCCILRKMVPHSISVTRMFSDKSILGTISVVSPANRGCLNLKLVYSKRIGLALLLLAATPE